MGLAMWFRDDSKTSDGFSIADGVKVNDVLLEALLQGETITREKALMLPPVAGAVDFIANSVACMPVKLYKRKQGKVEEVEGDNRVKLLNGDTGDTLDAFQMKKAMVEDYLLGKGGYCYIERDRNDVIALRYVKEIYVCPIKNYHPIYKDYVINVMGGEYYPWEFIKLLRNTKDGAFGIGITAEISKTLETAYRTLLYQLNLVSTGGGKKGFLKSQRKLAQEEIDILKASWNKMYSNSSENAVVLNNGVEFQEASNSSVENQINESKRTLTDEINDLFHISDDFEDTYKKAIYPIVKAFEVALNRDVLLEKEKKNHFFEFDIKEILRVTMKERYEAYKTAKETGFLTLNEIRRYENLNHIEGLDVVNVGLGAVLYDANTHEYYTPNTDTKALAGTENMLEGHVFTEEFDASGNSSARQERFNPNHDKKTGQFTFGKGGKSSSGRKYGKTDASDAAKEIKSGTSNSLEGHLTKNGNLTRERNKLHKDIVDKKLKGKTPVKGQATMTMLGGGPASGKSSVMSADTSRRKHAVTVDPDDMKKQLPGFKEMAKKDSEAAAHYHEESSALSKRFYKTALSENYDVIYDGTGDGSVKSVKKKIDAAKKNGYRVDGKYVTVDTEEAVRRNQRRYDDAVAEGKTPRLPDPKLVREKHMKVTDISVATAPDFDHIEIWDNNGAKGEQVKIAEGGNGKYLSAVAGQESKFRNYLAKGERGVDGFEFLPDGQVRPKQ